MTTNYDLISEQYKRAKQQPWRTHIECFTFLKLIGDVAGKCVIDLACGEGFYTRLMRHKGASKVTGVDLSHGMIDLAAKQEADQRLGIEYIVQDCRNLQLADRYDLAIAAYLLNYARHRQELAAMCESIASTLKPGGRLVTVNSSPAIDFRTTPSYRQYGFDTTLEGDLVEGTPITWKIFLDGSEFSIENYFIDAQTHDEVLRSAGFREVRWHRPELSPEGRADFGTDFWTTFMEHPPVAFIECIK